MKMRKQLNDAQLESVTGGNLLDELAESSEDVTNEMTEVFGTDSTGMEIKLDKGTQRTIKEG